MHLSYLSSYHDKLTTEHFYHLQKKPHIPLAAIRSSIFPSPKQPQIYFLPLYICLFMMFHINGILQHAIFYVWLLSPSKTFVRFMRLVAFIKNSIFFFFFIVEWCVLVWVCHIFFISSHVNGHLGCSHFLTVRKLLWIFACESWCRLFFGEDT